MRAQGTKVSIRDSPEMKTKNKPSKCRITEQKGHIYLYTGTGGGKTTNALGLALRSTGHKRKVVIIQFLKWWKNTGEYKIRRILAPNYETGNSPRRG
jgi:ATP:corrinoid adenosyltransferase